jgi:hypothetical protein
VKVNQNNNILLTNCVIELNRRRDTTVKEWMMRRRNRRDRKDGASRNRQGN